MADKTELAQISAELAELKTLFTAALAEIKTLRIQIADIGKPTPSAWVDLATASAHLGKSPSYFRRHIKSGSYPTQHPKFKNGCWRNVSSGDRPTYEIHLENWQKQATALATGRVA
jgi:hypothetical protein